MAGWSRSRPRDGSIQSIKAPRERGLFLGPAAIGERRKIVTLNEYRICRLQMPSRFENAHVSSRPFGATALAVF
jgi:hypothetical protein